MVRLRSPPSTVPAGILAPAFLQRSPPSLFTTAACSGLGSVPDDRTRRALLHLSYSCISPFGPAIFVTHVEWPGGISPPGSPRTVREPLDSHGSRCSAVAMTQLPVGEQIWIGAAKPVEPISRSFGFATQPLELAARPANDIVIDHAYPVRSGRSRKIARRTRVFTGFQCVNGPSATH